ncbi:MAG: ABC transporter substrate-binding protein, partial [Bacteroidia bacterium]|nr:ABC transporter substrate-binding protein [Bacteroidia bacterium]
MKKLLLAVICITLLSACGGGKNKSGEKHTAKGPVFYGGVFNMNEVEDFKNLFPLSVIEQASFSIASQVYQGLVRFNQSDLSIIPCIAESWAVNDNATIFTFKVRKGVKFHDDACFGSGEGREVTAQDIKYCFDKICESHPLNQGYFLFKDRVKGANEYYQSTLNKKPLQGGVSGIKVVDANTIQIDLLKPYSGFLNLLAMPYAWIYPKEAFDKYGMEMRTKCVGTGPFTVKEVKEGEAVILIRNPKYWDIDEYGNQLPYLDAVKITFIKEKKAELLEFRKQNLHFVYQLPLEMIDEVVGELEDAKAGGNPSFQMQVMPSLAVQFLGFQTQLEPFKDKLVRLAFNYAIDRDAIVNFTLKGDGSPAKYGFVPPIKDYDCTHIKGYTFDPEKARKLLAQAGFPGGKGLPAIELSLNAGGNRNTQVAEVIQKQLKENLGVDVQLNVIPFAQHIENMENGKAQFFRVTWVADYPDPENFISWFSGDHVPDSPNGKAFMNFMRYKNPTYDNLLKQAQ